MTQEEWNTYIDTGFVPHSFIKEIVNGIKKGHRLTSKHLQVYITHKQIIEIYLNKKMMKKIKLFEEFINESALDLPIGMEQFQKDERENDTIFFWANLNPRPF